MIDVTELIKKTIKKEVFNENEGINKAARQVLSEMKTKFKDIKESITVDIQNKMLIKMKKDRENSINIYEEAFAKTSSDIAKENLDKSKNELNVINAFLSEIEKDMPKQITENEVIDIIKENNFSNIGDCMKWFSKNYPAQDKKMISQIFKK